MFGQPDFMEEIDCGSLFDHIDDLLEFPPEDPAPDGVAAAAADGGGENAFPSIWNNPSDGIPDSNPVLSGNGPSDLSAQLSVPYEDMVQLEWLSTFVEDSFSGGSAAAIQKDDSSLHGKEPPHRRFHMSSPVSVLESSSSSSGEKNPPPPPATDVDVLACCKPGRARSKRPRPAAFSPRLSFQVLSRAYPAGDLPEATPLLPRIGPDVERIVESHPPRSIPVPAGVKKKVRRMKVSFPWYANQDPPPTSQAVRKCQHCEITKTPQWRAGPMGPKTLCNACGVRFKSGRLFPEYRPAASPTFVPALHSNSHKKVLEMRVHGGGEASDSGVALPAKKTTLNASATAADAATAVATHAEIVPNRDGAADHA